MTTFYKPYRGKNYKEGGLLLMSESAYCWPNDETGSMECPRRDHPTGTVKYWAWKHFEDRGKEAKYAAWLTRALCQTISPRLDEREAAWNEVSYSIFVQRPMASLKHRPTPEDLVSSGEAFLKLIELLRPGRVVITSITCWNEMPNTVAHPLNEARKQPYRLADGVLSWCLAVPHQRARRMGWERLGECIHEFRNEHLPGR